MSADLATAQSVAIVADRANLGELRTFIDHAGGAWRLCIDSWPLDMAYMVAVAGTPERIVGRAPLIIFALSRDELPDAIARACAELDDIDCAWAFLVADEARDIAARVVLRDAAPAGNA